MNSRYEVLYHELLIRGQEHILQFYHQLSDSSRKLLLDQVESMDWARLQRLTKEALGKEASVPGELSPMEAYPWETYSPEEKRYFEELGWSKLRIGKVAAIVAAGGQGSRLGHPGPKGTFSIGLPSGKSLFQLQAERLLNLAARAGCPIPWCIMTSPDNHEETVRFFENHRYFGYSPKDLFFFIQGELPALDEQGKVLLAEKDRLNLSPSGNGEAFLALERSGILQELKRRGVEWLFYYNVDNAIIKIADPRFVGVAAHYGRPIATKAAYKVSPEEKVGILCKREGRPAVLEYTEVPFFLTQQRDADGKYLYGLGNLSIHLFRMDFVERHLGYPLSYHAAHKKLQTVDEAGHVMMPESPNGYKLEQFIFDYFPLADEMTVLVMDRMEEFAPVKNRTGEDSPETARRQVLDVHKRWRQAAGVDTRNWSDDKLEISPLDSYAGESLEPPAE
jgi:UDP-N-acetylglucosamine/UDP-N-acetylgalactosamine diphosphorylase